jgi:thiol:disulfide interchange protein DsbC
MTPFSLGRARPAAGIPTAAAALALCAVLGMGLTLGLGSTAVTAQTATGTPAAPNAAKPPAKPAATPAAKPGAPGAQVGANANANANAPIPEAAIRKVLQERISQLAKIDEISRTPIPGLYEVRYAGTELLYTDATGEHILVGGSMIETRTRTDLTEARMEKLLAVDFGKLPLRDAIAIKQGTGVRKVAVFVDPNCGYCKRFERDLSEIKDVTVYTFLLPILGPDSTAKTRDIWCAKDNAKVWRSFMIDGVPPPAASEKCDVAAIDRNLAFGRTHKINGTPAVLFEDGTRKPGALPPEMLERLLATATAARKR